MACLTREFARGGLVHPAHGCLEDLAEFWVLLTVVAGGGAGSFPDVEELVHSLLTASVSLISCLVAAICADNGVAVGAWWLVATAAEVTVVVANSGTGESW